MAAKRTTSDAISISAAGNKINPKSSNNAKAIKELNNNNDTGLLSTDRTWKDAVDEAAFEAQCNMPQFEDRLIGTIHFKSSQSDFLEIQDFIDEYKIPRQTYYDMLGRKPRLKRAHEDMKRRIARNLRKGAIQKRYEKEMVIRELHRYDPEEHDNNLYWREDKATQAKAEAETQFLLAETLRQRAQERVNETK